MLFNPKWFRPQRTADPFGLDTLIAWLEIQPPDERYDYRNCHGCLLAQYFREHGWESVEVSKNFVSDAGSGLLSVKTQSLLPEFFNWIAEDRPHSYRGALRRAKIARDRTHEARKRALDVHNQLIDAEDFV